MPAPRRDPWILLIGIGKALKSVSLLVLGCLVLGLVHKDPALVLGHWAFVLGINPGNHLLREALDHANLLDDAKLRLVALGMLVYSALFAVEGAGLLLQKRWGEYVAVVITGSFIPLEVYETVRHPHVGRAITIVLNVAAVAYLVHKIRTSERPSASGTPASRTGSPLQTLPTRPPAETGSAACSKSPPA
jgi:uncharacterized membrane protein (DUF2068 family)